VPEACPVSAAPGGERAPKRRTVTLIELFELDPLLARFTRLEPAPAGMPVEGDCWVWTGASQKSKRNPGKRYGRVWRGGAGGKAHYPHRYVQELVNGVIPAGYEVHHHCKRTLCFNPAHTETLEELAHDAAERGEAWEAPTWSPEDDPWT
jgi:hypothetical protein